MDDLASLGIKIDFAEVQKAINLLDQLADRGPKAEGAVEGIGKAARRSSTEMGLLTKAAAGLFGALSIKMLFDLADGWSDISSRVNLAAGSMEKGAAVMDRLQAIARNTYSSLGQTAEGYLSNAASMRELGYSTQQVLDYTSALNNAMVVSGAKAERAASVQNALAKAMALGKLSGDNLNTVIQTGGEVATLLAARFNTTTGGLMKLGQQGKLTGDILVDTLIKAMSDLEEKAGNMPATIADGFGLIGNALLQLVGMYDQAGKVSETFAEQLVWVADNLQSVLTVGLSLAVGFGGAYVYSLLAAKAATTGLTISAIALRSALVSTGIGAIAVGVGLLIDQFMRLADRVGGFGILFGLLGDIASEVWGRIVLSGKSAASGLGEVWLTIQQSFLVMLATMTEKWADFLHNLASSMANIPGMGDASAGIRGFAIEAGSSFYSLTSAANSAGERAKALNGEYVALGNAANAPLESMQALRDAMDKNNEQSVSLEDKIARLSVAANDNSKAMAKAAKAYADLLRTAKDRVSQMELEEKLVGKNAIAADVLRIKLETLQEVERKGLKLSPDQLKALDDLADKYGVVARRVAELNLMQDAAFDRAQIFRSPIDQQIMQDLRSAGIEIDSIGGQAYAQQVRLNDQLGLSRDLTKDFASGFISDMMSGKSALEALTNALGKLADKLLDMALDAAINGLFKNLLGSVGGGMFGGTGSGLNFFPAAPSMGGGGMGLFANGGISDKPAIFGEAGPEAAVPLPDGRSIPVRFYGEANNNSSDKGQNSPVVVELRMSPDVEARIIEQSGNQSVALIQESNLAQANYKQNGGSF